MFVATCHHKRDFLAPPWEIHMLIRTTLTQDQMEDARLAANEAGDYAGNIRFNTDRRVSPVNKRGHYTYRLRLVPMNSRARGARYAASGRHCAACSWEAHRDFMRAVFALDPQATIETGMIRYRGADQFERTHKETRNTNVGGPYAPVRFGDLSIY
jgi:hypothetical protein